MHDFGDELASRVAASQRAFDAEGARPLGGTADMIRRKRAVRHGATAGLTVVAVGLLATTGAFASQHLRGTAPVTPVDPPASATPSPDSIVTIQADGPNPTVPTIGIQCGDPAPRAAVEADGFTLQVVEAAPSPEQSAAGYLTGSAQVSSSNQPIVPAYALDPEIVVVQNGVVVGVATGSGLTNPVSFAEGQDQVPNDWWVGPSVTCADGNLDLAPGKYEFYVVSTVANSPELAAIARATESLGAPVRFTEDQWLEPTDWECTHLGTSWDEAAYENMPPNGAATCLPANEPQITWDATTRSVVLPYSDDAVGDTFSTSLIAGPFDYEYPANALWSDPEPEFAGTACGVEIPWDEDKNSVAVHTRPFHEVLRAGGGTGEALLSPTFGPGEVEARSTEVLVPDGGLGVIVEQRDVVNDDGMTTDVTYTVVGHADVTVNGGDQVAVSRATGPVQVEVEIEDVTWCGAEPSEGLASFAISMTVFPDELVGGEDGTPKLRFYPLG